MESSRIIKWLSTLLCALLLLKTQGQYVPLTRLESAVSKGAGENFLVLFRLLLFIFLFSYWFYICNMFMYIIVEKLKC